MASKEAGFSLLSQLLALNNSKAIAMLLLSTTYLNKQSDTAMLASLPDTIASPTQRSLQSWRRR
jgi:hypothetical protein